MNYFGWNWRQCLTAVLLTMTMPTSARVDEWQAHEVRQLGEKAGGVRFPAKLQIVTEQWNRVASVPYIVIHAREGSAVDAPELRLSASC